MERFVRGLLASTALFAMAGADIGGPVLTERLEPRDLSALGLTPAASATLPEDWYYYGCWTYVSGG